MKMLKIALTCTALMIIAAPSISEARTNARSLGFTGHAARSKIVKLYRQRGLAKGKLRVSALRITRSRKSRVFKITNRTTGETRLAMQNVRTLKIRLLKVTVPGKPQVTPQPQPKPTPKVENRTRTVRSSSGGGTRYNAETYSRALTGGLIRSSYSPSGRGGYRSIP